MPKSKKPRSGSMQFWPRKRAKRSIARVNYYVPSKDAKLLGFAGYKVGMTHVIATDGYKFSPTKGEEISIPVTVIECPPLKLGFIRFYKNKKVVTQIISANIDKSLNKKIDLPKKAVKKIDEIKEGTYDDVTGIVYTQPKLTGIGKKKPELFEIPLGGKLEEKLQFLKDNLGKDIPVTEIFKEGEILDFHAITKGKGFQGPVKRFGIKTRSHKSEKGIRVPGSISGGWVAQGHMMYRTAHAGQHGYHTRTEFNKLLLKIGTKPEEVNQVGGFMRYGIVKNQYILIKGSVGGPRKRLVRFNNAIRATDKNKNNVSTVEKISITRK